MIYAEASYFEGFHFAHIAAYEEARRLQHHLNQARRFHDRRQGSRNLRHG